MAETTNWNDLTAQAGPEVASSFEAIPADTYDLEVVAAEGKLSGAGNKYWKIQTKVLGGTFNNRRVFSNITLTTGTEGALNYFFAKMSVLGLPRTYFNTGPSDEAIANALVGRRFKAKVGQEPYQGDVQNTIDRFMKALDVAAPGGAAPTGPPAPAAPPGYAPPPAAPQQAYAPPVAAAQPSAAPVQAAGTVPPPPALEGLPF